MKAHRHRVNRRALFRGLGQTKAPAPNVPDPLRAGANAGRFDLLKASRPAMGSYFEVRLPAHVPGALELATRALDRIDELESQLTVYRDDSELSRLNATAHLGPVKVEAGLFSLLERALAIHRETQGAYDVAAGALSVAWGFFRGPKRVPEPEALADARARTGSHHLRIDRTARTLAFDRPGIFINLGSIGKGYAIDRAVDLIRRHWWPTPTIVHGGQSSLYALGSPPDRFGGRWQVALRNPFDPSRPLGTIQIRNRGLGTSGASFQRFEAHGQVFGHILDPRTGQPATSGPASVTVLAPTAAEADALSTAFYLLGPEETAAYVARHPGVTALFVLEGASDGSPRVLALGADDADFVADPTIPVLTNSRTPV